jgi:hypothetical protein
VPVSRKQMAAEIAANQGVPEAARKPAKSNSNDIDAPIWGVPAIAAAIGRPVQGTYYLVRCGEIPATRIGGQWVTTQRRLNECFNGAEA